MQAQSPPQIVILLATFQGEAFLDAQLTSIAGQTHANWSLIVSDDGSKDRTRDIVNRFAACFSPGRVRLIDGPRAGATQNFLHLIGQTPPGVMMAFCDQDDVWFPNKLERAAAALRPCPGAAHYAARTLICDARLKPLAGSRHFRRPLGFRNALVQACMAGNSSVFNARAAELLVQTTSAAQNTDVVSHDWWAYQLIAGAGGTIIHDPEPAVFYRQHLRSEVGRNDTLFALKRRFSQLSGGAFAAWLAKNIQALQAARSVLTPQNRAVLDGLDAALDMPGHKAARALLHLGLYRHTVAGTMALLGAAALGRLQRH